MITLGENLVNNSNAFDAKGALNMVAKQNAAMFAAAAPDMAEMAQTERRKKQQVGLSGLPGDANRKKQNGVARKAGVARESLFGGLGQLNSMFSETATGY